MNKKVAVFMVCCFFIAIATTDLSAATGKARVLMEKHMEKVKRTKPAEYQKMFKEANGNIVSCLSCHKDLMKKPSK